jgi:ABC-type phosphate transport system substrate-binding protein
MSPALPDYPRSQAVLIGTAVYRDRRFRQLPAARNSLNAVREVLVDERLCGWPGERVAVLLDHKHRTRLITDLRRWARETTDVLIVYFAGHGIITPQGELCLALTDTALDDPDVTGLEYRFIRSALIDSPARVKVVILDCCYSGRAIQALSSPQDFADIRGAYVIAASDLAAHVPPPTEQPLACTSFTGELLKLIRTGIPGAADTLTLHMIYTHLRSRLRSAHLPDPNVWGTGTAGDFGLTLNAAYQPDPQGDAGVQDPLRGGGLVTEVTHGRKRFAAFGRAGLVLLALFAAVIVTLVVRPSLNGPPAAADCVAGSITAEGSTEFGSAVQAVAESLRQQCPRSVVTVNPPGSLIDGGGAADLQARGGSARVGATLFVMSDGALPRGPYPKLVPHPVAIAIFGIVVNPATRIYSLTEAQLAGIWSGQYKNWTQLGGANLPIDILTRNIDSGIRAIFDQEVLKGNELPASSESCTKRDLNPASPVILCEKSSTQQLLQAVSVIPGAIGYALDTLAQAYPHIDEIQLNGVDASAGSVAARRYPFYTVETLYTYGTPPPSGLLAAFLEYFFSEAADSIIQDPFYGDIPCSFTTACG